MAALKSQEIISAIEDAFSEASTSASLISEKRTHPRRFYIVSSDLSFPLWIYIWTLTHGGGRARPVDEFRIQLTSVTPPLLLNPDGPTLLLGFDPSTRCFAGFDIKKHLHFSQKSPSIQINITALRDASTNGFSFVRKGNKEIAIGFRPDNILIYSLNADSLHKYGADRNTAKLLSKVTRFEEITKSEEKSIPEERRRIISKISRLARESDFRRKVIVAYDRKCAVTGLQLRLIEAAHILRVGASGSTDEVTNGICLSPTYHRAYDRGLIYLSEDYTMVIDESKKQDLIRNGQGGGIAQFESFLNKKILLPPDRRQWPDRKYIKSANSSRN